MSATRVLICDDSRTYAAALRRLLEHGGSIEVVGTAGSAEQAVAALPRLKPELVTMDIELPGISGLEAVEQIMGTQPLPILVLSSHVGTKRETAAAALAAGALDVVAKDDLDLAGADGAAASAFRHRVTVLSRAHVIRHPRAGLRRRNGRARRTSRAAAVGICASTGGPQTLAAVLTVLPASFAVPLLVVQHISPGFSEGLAHWLDGAVPLPVRMATPGVRLAPGVWIAPDDRHLSLGANGQLELDDTTVDGYHRPSGDVLFKSLASLVGKDAVAVVLSGMGRDGAAGARAIREAGGLVIAQDKESSAVYGMPKAAVDEGGAVSMSPAEIAARLTALEAVPVEGGA